RTVAALRNEPERFLATVQIGITVVGAAAAAIGGATIAEGMRVAFEHLGMSAAVAEFVALGIAVTAISYLSVRPGALLTKSPARRYAGRYALATGPFVWTVARLMGPAVRLLTATSNVVLRPFGDRTTFTEARLSPEELQELVEQAGKTGALDEETSEIAS